jgi:hypothetical protein
MQPQRARCGCRDIGYAPFIPIYDADPVTPVDGNTADDMALTAGRGQVEALLPIRGVLAQEMT